MMKLKVNSLQELAASLSQSEQLNNAAQCTVKGGCSSCEDGRRPPRGHNGGGNWGGSNQN
jgi:hypothetical protein